MANVKVKPAAVGGHQPRASEVRIFNSPEFGTIRIIVEGDKTLFCGADVAKALGYKNPRKAIGDHCRCVTKRYVWVQTGVQADGQPATRLSAVSFIPEGDLYRLIVHSKLPGAERFESWVFEEVLPSIRKYGAYATPQTIDDILRDPSSAIRILTALRDEQDKTHQLQDRNHQLQAENRALAAQVNHWDNGRILRALINSYARCRYGDNSPQSYAYSWNNLYQQVNYKMGINLRLRRTKNNNQGLIVDYIRPEEMPQVISVAAAMCANVGGNVGAIMSHYTQPGINYTQPCTYYNAI